MPSLAHLVQIGALRLVALPIRLLPRRAALELGAWIGRLGWWTGIRRSVALANLKQAFPDLTDDERLDLARTASINFGRTVAEFLRFAGRDRLRVGELVEIEGLEALKRDLEDGEGGALVVTAHLGSWALYVTALAASGVPSSLLVGQQTNPYVDRLILGIPGDAVRFISKSKQAPRRILGSLSEGHAVVMVADHYTSSEAVWAPFLGRTASTLPLPGALVAKRQLPLYVLRGTRIEGGRHRVVLRPVEIPDLSGDELRLTVAERCNEALGQEILDCPEQYWWYHERFKVRGKYRKLKKVLGDPPPVG